MRKQKHFKKKKKKPSRVNQGQYSFQNAKSCYQVLLSFHRVAVLGRGRRPISNPVCICHLLSSSRNEQIQPLAGVEKEGTATYRS